MAKRFFYSLLITTLSVVFVFAQHPKSGISRDGYNLMPEFAFKAGEELHFSFKYSFIHAADAVLKVEKTNVNFDGKPTFKLVGDGYTVGLTDFLYSVHDRYESYVSTETCYPYLYTEKVKESDYRREDFVKFDQKSGQISGNKTTVVGKPPVFDLISLFYFARNLDLRDITEGDIILLRYFLSDGVYNIQIRFVGRERVKTPLGYISCLKFQPSLKVGDVFSDEYGMLLWISNDKNHLPVKAKADVVVGSVTMMLTGIKGLKYSLNVSAKKK